ncbi:MAG: hypothetical protein KAR19_07395 [Bacteroidales bacterium]|nr:hypothetical protein [Bacteroidales bacterium]
MKKLILIFLTVFLSMNAISQESGLGLGVIIGEPTGLSAKLWTSEKTAIDAGVAWSFINSGFLHIHADMLVHSFLIDVDKGKLPLYFGIGGKLVLANDLGLGVRIPLGMAYIFDSAPIDIFIELVPVLDLAPATAFSFEGGIGVRYFF